MADSSEPAPSSDSAAPPAASPGVGGVIKAEPEDFLVEELPLYEPSGEGEHLYLFIEKRDLATSQAVERVAAHFGVKPKSVGYAGLKDKRAVTRQFLSVHAPGASPDRAESLEQDDLRVLWAARHGNKLKRGHLRGNRFCVWIREVGIEAAPAALRAVRALEREGVPNRFGEQRYGARGVNHLIGRDLIAGDWDDALRALLGRGAPGDDERVDGEARRLFEAGRHREARLAAPRADKAERQALRALERGASPEEALLAISRAQREFWISAFQAAIFDDLLHQRLKGGELHRIRTGDIVATHGGGPTFLVTEEALQAEDLDQRARRLEISPTGPLWGPAMRRAQGEVDQAERDALARAGVSLEQLEEGARRQRLRRLGGRRPMRVPLGSPTVEAGADERGTYLRIAFELQRGAYATTVLDSIIRGEAARRASW